MYQCFSMGSYLTGCVDLSPLNYAFKKTDRIIRYVIRRIKSKLFASQTSLSKLVHIDDKFAKNFSLLMC